MSEITEITELLKEIAATNIGERLTNLENQGDALERVLALQEGIPGGGGYNRKGLFNSLGDFAISVANASRPGGIVDDRLLKIQAAASGANETVPSEGGFLLEKTLVDPLLNGAFQTGLLAKYCFRLPVGANSNGLKIPAVDETSRVNGSRLGGVQAYWAAEADTVTKSKPKWRQIQLELNKLFAISYVTEELLQDSTSLGVFLDTSFREEMGFKVDDAIIRGTGTGMPQGLLNSGATVTVPKEGGQTASTVVYENIVHMYSRMLPRSRQRAIWLINQSVETELFTMTLSCGTGGVPVYLPASGAAGQPYPTLFGRPVITCEQCEVLGDKGDIIFADLGSYVLADKGGIQSASSIHVRFLNDEQTFRWTLRLDGSSLYNSVVTPYKGSDTLGPYVVLEARE